MTLKEAIQGIDIHTWASEEEVGIFIGSLMKMSQCKNVIEVGVFKGLTSCYMIENLQIDGTYTGIDIKDFRCESVKKFMEDRKQTFILGDSKKELAKLSEKNYDLIFLDSSHDYEQVKTEFKLSERLIKQNGIICIHDYYSSEGVPKWVNEIKTMNWFEIVILQTPDNRGLAVVKCLHK